MHISHSFIIRFSDKNSPECSYFYIPIWIIFAVNQLLFALTALKIHRTKQHRHENTRQIIVLLMASRELDQNGINNEEGYVFRSLSNKSFAAGNLFSNFFPPGSI